MNDFYSKESISLFKNSALFCTYPKQIREHPLFTLIETIDKLRDFTNKASKNKWLALDTEFLREKTYYSKLCLVQIEAGGQRACIDPLKIKDLTPLYDLLKNPDITKVLHAAHQDLEIFKQLMGEVPTPVFDTQLAAAVLGYGDQMGYARLIEHMLGVHLKKTQTRTDWSKRPLNEAQLDYAIDDVRYLAKIYPKMREQLINKNRLHWLDRDFKRIANPETYAINTRERWEKVRGNQTLKRPQLSVLRELAAWREEIAEKSNRPRKWILSDDLLLDLARQQPASKKDLAEIRGLNPERIEKNANQWLSLIKTGQNIPEEEMPELPRSKKPTPTQNALIDLLMLALQIKAKEEGITPTAIAGRKQIAAMVQNGQETLSDDWRGNLVNELFSGIISGQKIVRVENGKVVIETP